MAVAAFSPAQAREIRTVYRAGGVSLLALAQQHRVSANVISAVVKQQGAYRPSGDDSESSTNPEQQPASTVTALEAARIALDTVPDHAWPAARQRFLVAQEAAYREAYEQAEIDLAAATGERHREMARDARDHARQRWWTAHRVLHPPHDYCPQD